MRASKPARPGGETGRWRHVKRDSGANRGGVREQRPGRGLESERATHNPDGGTSPRRWAETVLSSRMTCSGESE